MLDMVGVNSQVDKNKELPLLEPYFENLKLCCLTKPPLHLIAGIKN